MLNYSRLLTTIVISLSFLIVYFTLLSSSGAFERKKLNSKLKTLKVEVERLENENTTLKARHKILKNDQEALKHEAYKYYLLTENAKVIKFKEAVSKENQEKVLVASQLPQITTVDSSGATVPKTPPIGLIRFFYVVTATLLSIGVYIKLKG